MIDGRIKNFRLCFGFLRIYPAKSGSDFAYDGTKTS